MTVTGDPDIESLAGLLGGDVDLLERRILKVNAEERLLDFVELMWPTLEPGRKFIRGWALEGMGEHLEAVTADELQAVLFNVPPGFMKSLLVNVFWPAWEWGPKGMPWLRYVSASYSDDLTMEQNLKCRTLCDSELYKQLWPHVQFDPKQDTKTFFQTTKFGFKFATSVGGVGTGKRGDRKVTDDPINVKDTASEAVLATARRWFSETWPTRTNDEKTKDIIIMQRVTEDDTSEMALRLGYTHYCVPQRFEVDHPSRWFGGGHIAHDRVREKVEQIEETMRDSHADAYLLRMAAFAAFLKQPDASEVKKQAHDEFPVSWAPQFGKGDPRTEDGELAWPELFSEDRVAKAEAAMMIDDPEFAVAGQMQQRPVSRGGGRIKEDMLKIIGAHQVPHGGITVRGWDLAGSMGKKSPYTAGVKMKMVGGSLYVMHVHLERVDSALLEDWLVKIFREDGPAITQCLPQDPAQAGKFQKAALAKRMHGLSFKFSPEQKDKVARAQPFVSQCGAGNVYIVSAPWTKTYVGFITKFPATRFKDAMDATSRAHMELTFLSGMAGGEIGGAPIITVVDDAVPPDESMGLRRGVGQSAKDRDKLLDILSWVPPIPNGDSW